VQKNLARCEICDIEIGYLPYKCKYCGLVYCKKHRLPENHDCSFMLKDTVVVPTTSRDSAPLYRDKAVEVSTRDYKQKKEISRYEKRFQKSSYSEKRGFYITNYLLFTILGVSLAALYAPNIVGLSLYNLVQFPDYYWIFATSLFTVTSAIITFGIFYVADIYDFIIFLILVIIFYPVYQNVEKKYGKDFLVITFVFSAIITCIFAIVYRVLLLPYYPIHHNTVISYGFAMGGLYGVISFFIFNTKFKEIDLIGDLKANKSLIIIILILLRILPWLVAGVTYYAGYLLFLPDLAGILAGYVVYLIKGGKKKIKKGGIN